MGKKELFVSDELMARVIDLSKPTITFQDSLECALVGASELGDSESYAYVQSIIDIENSIKDNEYFKNLQVQVDKITESFKVDKATEEWLEKNRQANTKLMESFKPLIDQTTKIRDEALKMAQSTGVVEVVERLQEILTRQKQAYHDKAESAKKSADECKKEMEELEVQIEESKREQKRVELELKFEELESEQLKWFTLCEGIAPKLTSNYARKMKSNAQEFIIKKVYKKRETNEYYIKRNQEIVDKNYDRKNERPVDKVYADIAKDYNELSAEGVKKVIYDHDAPTPTKLKSKK